jgi:hypothetical protein
MPNCKLCGSDDVQFGVLCEACKGMGGKSHDAPLGSLNPDGNPDNSMHACINPCINPKGIPDDAESPPTCNTCGEPIVPFRVGQNMVKKGICKPCLMKKKYGPNWVPGGKKSLRVPRKKREDNKGVKMAQAPIRAPFVYPDPPELRPDIWIFFEDEDKALHTRLKDIAKRERRTIQQQILWFIDRMLIAQEDVRVG